MHDDWGVMCVCLHGLSLFKVLFYLHLPECKVTVFYDDPPQRNMFVNGKCIYPNLR